MSIVWRVDQQGPEMHVPEQLNCLLEYVFCSDSVRRLDHVRPHVNSLVSILLADVFYFVISSVIAAEVRVEVLPAEHISFFINRLLVAVLKVLSVAFSHSVSLLMDLLSLRAHGGNSLWSGPPIYRLYQLRLIALRIHNLLFRWCNGSEQALSVSIEVSMLMGIVLHITNTVSIVPMMLLDKNNQEIFVDKADQVTRDVEHRVGMERLL
jgi:hypothetical protein